MPLPATTRTTAHGRNIFIWHEGTDAENAGTNVIGCRDHIALQVWLDPATRRIVCTVEAVEGVNRKGGYTVRYIANAETGPFDDQATLIKQATGVLHAAIAELFEVEGLAVTD